MKQWLLVMMLLISGGLACCAASPEELVYQCNFTPGEMKAWRMSSIGSVNDGVLTIKAKPGVVNNTISIPFDYAKYAGDALRLECQVRYSDVTQPRQAWNGTKLMFVFQSKGGKWNHLHPVGEYGSKDWHMVSHIAFIDPAALKGEFRLGLEDAQGTIQFSKLRIYRIAKKDIYPSLVKPGFKAAYTERVTGDKKRRGMMSPSTFTDKTITKDLPDLKSWGANLIRWQLIRNWSKIGSDQDVNEYLAWVEARIPEIRQVLDAAHKLDMKVVLDLHVPPGGRRRGGEMNMFYDRKFADAFLEAWRKLATAVKGHPALYGFDLINEPVQQPGAPIDYLALQFDAAKVVRAIDPVTPIIIESNNWDSPDTYVYLSPIPLENVIYQVHMYAPGFYTHQGVHKKPLLEGSYPGKLNGVNYDKEALRRILQPVRDFQQKYAARIYVGEFSVIRWGKGGEQYLRDCTDLFEEFGWDWSYHAFREWSGWSVEHSDNKADDKPVAQDTGRKKVLLEKFRKNQ